MLQSNMPQNDRATGSPDGIEPNGTGDLVNSALGFLRRQYLLIVLGAAFALVASAIYLEIVPPTYTAQARVLLKNSKAPFLQQQSVLAEAPVDSPEIESQLLILKSEAVAASVIDQLGLAADPEFKHGEGRFRWIRKAVRGWLGDRKIDPRDALIAEFDDRLSAARLGYSSVIEISFSAANPERAAEIANAVATAYMNDQLKAKADANRAATAWLHHRLQELGRDALNAERAVNELKSKNDIVAAGGKPVDDQQVTDLNSRLVAARTRTSEALARLNRVETILASNSSDAASISSLGGSGPDALNNPVINSLREQYFENARREYELSVKYGSNHQAVVNLRTTMKGILGSILEEVRRLAEISKSDFEVAKQQQQEIEKQLAQAVSQSRRTSSAELSIRELETSAREYRSLYDSFLQRYMGTLQQESFPISEARVISPATPPKTKSKPKPGIVVALGLVGGIALGMALGFLREMMDRGFRTSEQVEAALHLPCLSLVPLLRDLEQKESSRSAVAQVSPDVSERRLSRSGGIHWQVSAMPLSQFAESIRSIRLAVDCCVTRGANKIVGITSTLPNEGKSTIAASLGQILAHLGKRVIVVDCDLRNPSLSANFSPKADSGIIEVLAGTRSLEQAIWTHPKTGLAFLPVAKKAPLLHTSEILSTEQTRELFEKLRATYDCVIVDLPPLAPIIDVRATAPLIDCFILVVEWGRTTADVIQHALRAAPDVYEATVGTVLNKTDMRALKRYAGYHGYYNDAHYIRYGDVRQNENA